MADYGSFALFEPSDPAFPVTASTDRPAGNLIEDDPEDIRRYTMMFDHLRASSLSPAASRALIDEAMSLL